MKELWEVKSHTDRERCTESEQERKMDNSGGFVRKRGGDEILPYLSRQLHFVESYLGRQRGM